MNAKQVQAWLGHHRASVTLDSYVHLLSDELPESPLGEEVEAAGETLERRRVAVTAD